MSITKITTPELLDFPNDSTSSANTSGTVIPTGYTNACNFPTFSSGVSLYQFENNTDDTCGTYNLTAVGSPAYVSGKFGQAIQFNGTSQGATSTSAVIPKPAATISLWFNGNGTATAEFYIIGAGVGGSSYGLDIHYYNSGFWAGVVDAGVFQGVGGGVTTVNTSTWYHLALTWDGSTNTDSMKLYLNGALETNITPTVTAASLTYSSFGIGKTATATYAPGIVDQVRIFNNVLTSTQITELYNETTTEVYRPTTSLNAGEFRFNTTAGCVEYYDGSNWQQIADEYITGQPTTCECNYPIRGTALYQFNDNLINTCGSPTGTATGITYGAGQFNNAVDLNGSTGKISLGNQTWFNAGDYSVSFWMRNEGNDSNYQIIVSQRTSTDAGSPINISMYGVSYGSNNGMLYFNVGGSYFVSNTALSKNTWYHVVFIIVAGGAMNIYINGVLDSNSTTESTTRPTPTNQNLAIGANGSNNDYPFNGKIDQFRVFNSALSATQVSELYNEIPCN